MIKKSRRYCDCLLDLLIERALLSLLAPGARPRPDDVEVYGFASPGCGFDAELNSRDFWNGSLPGGAGVPSGELAATVAQPA